MKSTQLIMISTFILSLILITVGYAAAQSSPQQYFGDGGEITGMVLGGGSQPVDWAAIYAKDGQHTFQAFSGMSGVYQMRVPTGTYNVTVNASGYNPVSTNVTVSINSSSIANFYLTSLNVSVPGGSSSVINIYLTQVPEFQPSLSLTLIVLTLAVTLLLRRSSRGI